MDVIGRHREDPRERLSEDQHQTPGDTIAEIEAVIMQKSPDRDEPLLIAELAGRSPWL